MQRGNRPCRICYTETQQLNSQVQQAYESDENFLKNNRASGCDGLTAELFKNEGEVVVVGNCNGYDDIIDELAHRGQYQCRFNRVDQPLIRSSF